MPLSGVRISWTDRGEEARLGAVGGFGLVARRGERVLGLDAVGDVAADALHFGRPRRRAPRLRARRSSACRRRADDLWSCTRVPSGEHRHGALRENGQFGRGADQGLAAAAGERAEGVIGVSDAAAGVAAHDQVALRLQQTARALFGLAQLPIVVGQLLDARLQRAHLLRVRALAHQHEGDDRASGGEQRADAGAVGVRIVIRALQAHAGEEAEPAGDDRHGGHDGAAEQHQRRLVARAPACQSHD